MLKVDVQLCELCENVVRVDASKARACKGQELRGAQSWALEALVYSRILLSVTL
jgi:hypothetical protein